MSEPITYVGIGVQRGEQRRRAVALVVMGLLPCR